jgi:hypothetical protein
MQSDYFEEEIPEHIQNYIENFEPGGPEPAEDNLPRKDSTEMEFGENIELEFVAPQSDPPRKKIFSDEPAKLQPPVHSLKTSKSSYKPKPQGSDPTTLTDDQLTTDPSSVIDEEQANLRIPSSQQDKFSLVNGPPHTGNTYCYWFDKKTGAPRIVWGPNWPFTICVVTMKAFITGGWWMAFHSFMSWWIWC